MKCDKAQEFFSDYIETTLDRPMTVALESHLSGCEACNTDVTALRSLFTVLDKVPQVEPPADFVWRTTTRLQNEFLNRQEAVKAKPLPWWKRLTPVQSFSYAGIAALLVIGVTIPLRTDIPQVIWGAIKGNVQVVNPVQPVAVMTAPQFKVMAWSQGGATVAIRATSSMPGAGVFLAQLTPSPNRDLVGRFNLFANPTMVSTGQGWNIPISSGVQATKILVESHGQKFVKTVLLPGTQPAMTSLQDVGADLALKQIATLMARPILLDDGLTGRVTLDLQNVPPQQALEQVLAQVGGTQLNLPNNVIGISPK